MKHQLRKGLCLLLLGGILFSIAAGQSGRRQRKEESGSQTTDKSVYEEMDVLRVRTDEVMLPVSVRDFMGKPVNGLGAEQFLIYDNGVLQKIASFNRRRVPADIVLLLDASGSVFHQMRFIREAARNFIEGLLKEDKVCVMQFADSVELLHDWASAGEAEKLWKALDWRYHPGDSTHFYDGLYLAAEEQLKKSEGRRRIVILLTDGIDTAERKGASFQEAVNAIRRAEASVYVVSLTASLRESIEKRTKGTLKRLLSGYDPKEVKRVLSLIDESEASLEKLAKETGGRMFLPKTDEELLPAYKAIAEELRTQYIITYKPVPRALAGEWRRLRVLVLQGAYDVAAREGYKGRS